MKKEGAIIFLAVLILGVGVSIAYYNTSSFGYDNENIVSFNNESVKIFDYNIEYKEIKEKLEEIDNAIPKDFITV